MMPSPHSLPPFTDLLLDAIFLVDVQGRIVYTNAACERIFGYTQEEMVGQAMMDFVAPEDRESTRQEAAQIMAGRPRIGFENRYIRKDGRRVHLMWSARWSEDEQLRIGVARDMTELKHAQQMQEATYAISEAAHKTTDLPALFREIHEIIAKLVPVAGFAIATCDQDMKQLHLCYRWGFDDTSAGEEDAVILQHCAEAIRGKPQLSQSGKMPATSGGGTESAREQAAWLKIPLIIQDETIGAMVLKGDSEAGYAPKEKELLHFVSEQVTATIKRRQVHEELLQSARYDDLTGLPNRRLFHDRMQSALSRCRRRKRRVAMLFIDINRFKQVNDSLGHAAGDLLLQEVARRLKQSLREEDVVARLGGDEFVVLLEDIAMREDALAAADKIRRILHRPVRIDDQVLHPGVSIGVALYPEHGMEAEQLLKYADEAMYLDKKASTIGI